MLVGWLVGCERVCRKLVPVCFPLGAVQHYFPGKTDSEIKGYIRQKLQNEAKRLRKKPHLLTAKEEEPHLLPAKEEEPGAQGEETTTHT